MLTKTELSELQSIVDKEQDERILNIYESMLKSDKVKSGAMPMPTLESVNFIVKRIEEAMVEELVKQEDELFFGQSYSFKDSDFNFGLFPEGDSTGDLVVPGAFIKHIKNSNI